MNFKIALIFITTLYFVGTSYAQDQKSRPVEVNGDQVEYLPAEKKVVAIGNISIDYEDVRLTADKVVVYTQTKEAEAEGNVILKTPTGEARGNKIKYNFQTKQGEIIKARVSTGQWFAGGAKVDIVSGSEYRVKDGYITSCNLEKPHYKIVSKSVTIFPDNRIEAKNVTFKVGDIPVAYLPSYHRSLKGEWPVFNVIPGKKSRWGLFALTSYRYEMDEDRKLTLRLDVREKWGIGEGLDYKYAFPDFGNGILRTYYTHQRNRDRNEPIKQEEERFRIQLRHRWDIDKNTRAFMEYHRLSDTEITKDYFYREEYEREESPESYLYLLRGQPEYSISLQAKKRINRFQSVVERLPEIRFDLKQQSLFGLPLYFKTDTSFTSLNSKTANSAADLDVVRFDTFNKFSSPLRPLDFISITPFIGTRDTYYSKDINGDENEFRTAFYTGVDMSTKFFKTYDVHGSFLGIGFNRLRHIITPTIEYEYIHEPSMVSASLQQFDDIDNINRKNTFALGLENRLQTKRLIEGRLETWDLGYFLVKGDYLYKPENGSHFSNVNADLELTPASWLRIESDTQYDPASRDFQAWNLDFYLTRSKDWRLGFGSRYWQNQEHELTSELFYKLNNQWTFRLFGRFDLKEVESNGHKIINRFSTKEITIIKDLHCWLGEVTFSEDRDGGTTFWVSLRLKASPKVPFDFKSYYSPPKQK